MSTTTFTLNLWEALSVAGGIVMTLIVLARIILAQAETKQNDRFIGMGRHIAQTEDTLRQTDQRLMQLLTDLPLHYQRREDAIRMEVSLHHKLDALGEKMMRMLECNNRQCPTRNEGPTNEH